MRSVLRRLGWTVPAAAVLALAACNSATTPLNPSTPDLAPAQQSVSGAVVSQSITVRGVVTDQDGRPIARANVECMGDVRCTRSGYQVISDDGPDDGLFTDASGHYELVASGSARSFQMNAHIKAYDLDMATVDVGDSCTADRCSTTVNFRLSPQPD